VLCATLEVSESGYFAWRRRAPSRRAQADAALTAHIQTTFLAGRGGYGSPRVQAALRRQGVRCSRKRVARLMRARGPVCRATTPPHATESQHSQPVAPNLLGRTFTAEAPNRTWVADSTASGTRTGW
jgi:transposase InsO family protein